LLASSHIDDAFEKQVLNEYRRMLSIVTLWGPTNFAPTIEFAVSSATCTENKQEYTILLIVTDGAISDIVETMKAIRKGCKKPLSIVIVGVGEADFQTMEMLDGDDTTIADRDIVQFVAFRDVGSNPSRLAEELLREIPSQCEDYMALHNIKPNKAGSRA